MSILEGKVIVVIGASSGIGYAMCEYFAENGAKVGAFARREDRLKTLADTMNQKGKEVIYGICDATKYSDIQKACDDTIAKLGKIDVWVNCAGQNSAVGKVWELDVESIFDEIDTNLKSCIIGTQVVLQKMLPEKEGVILNFCGGGTDAPPPYIAAYATSKVGIARFTECTAMELNLDGYDNIKMFCTNPGLVYNERMQDLCDSDAGKKYAPNIAESFAIGKCQPPLNSAYLVESILSGELDDYKGKLIYSNGLKAMREDPANSPARLLRLVK